MEEILLYEELLHIKRSGQGGVFVTVVESEGSTPRKSGAKMLIREDGSTLGTVGGGAVEQLAKEKSIQVAKTGCSEMLAIELTEKHGMTCGGRVSLYLEPLTRSPQLLVVGKGHIAQALQQIATQTAFAVTLFDPPSEEHADFSFSELLADREIKPHEAYVVIACPTHLGDFIAAKAALDWSAGFVGVVGSQRKRESLMAFLAEKGCSQSACEAIFSPVGLAIGAETPAEIALSIMAQLVSKYRDHEQ
jgi:xanthine dehydrogenase accessory factor